MLKLTVLGRFSACLLLFLHNREVEILPGFPLSLSKVAGRGIMEGTHANWARLGVVICKISVHITNALRRRFSYSCFPDEESENRKASDMITSSRSLRPVVPDFLASLSSDCKMSCQVLLPLFQIVVVTREGLE